MEFGRWDDASRKLFQLEQGRNAEDVDTRSKEKGQIPEKVTKTLGVHKGINSDSETRLTCSHCHLLLVSLPPLAGRSQEAWKMSLCQCCHVHRAAVPCLSPSMLCFYFIYIVAILWRYNLHPIKPCVLWDIPKHLPIPWRCHHYRGYCDSWTISPSVFLNVCALLLLGIVSSKCFVHGTFNFRFLFTCQFKSSSLGFQILFHLPL